MKKTRLLTLLTLTLLFSSLSAGHRNCWTPASELYKRPEPQIVSEEEFASNLSDFHRKRYIRFSPAQKQAAYTYYKTQSYTPDTAVEQVSLFEYLRN
ncbi:MAG: hypothetical protein HYX48_06570 [Chlamydiales bacterium]|nr:hypothetical protein [Chlamydiales bacterium]